MSGRTLRLSAIVALALSCLPLGACVRVSLDLREETNDAHALNDGAAEEAAGDSANVDGFLPPTEGGADRGGIVAHPLVGELDPSFGDQGKVVLQRGTDADVRTFGAAIDDGGLVYLQGRRYTGGGRSSFLTARLLSDGHLDESYGSYGYVLEELSVYSYGYGVLLRPTGGLLLVGDHSGGATRQDDILVFALLENGFRDLAYGSSGAMAIDLGSSEDTAKVGALDSQGRLVLCGTGGYDLATSSFALLRLTAQGQMDGTFGTNGVVRTDGGGGAHCGALIVLPDDSVVGVGYATPTGELSSRGLAVHVNAQGGPAFASGQLARLYPDPRGLSFSHIERDSDGSWLVAGTLGGAPTTIAALRLDTSGDPVTSFGSAGVAEITLGGNDRAKRLSVGPDGKIVVGGSSDVSGTVDFAFARLMPDGRLDTTFGSAGQLIVDFDGNADNLEELARQADGRLIAVGWTDSTTRQQPVVLRLR